VVEHGTLLSKYAYEYLGRAAMSCPSERCFSDAGFLYYEQRASLNVSRQYSILLILIDYSSYLYKCSLKFFINVLLISGVPRGKTPIGQSEVFRIAFGHLVSETLGSSIKTINLGEVYMKKALKSLGPTVRNWLNHLIGGWPEIRLSNRKFPLLNCGMTTEPAYLFIYCLLALFCLSNAQLYGLVAFGRNSVRENNLIYVSMDNLEMGHL
jgi:hypothetical protein